MTTPTKTVNVPPKSFSAPPKYSTSHSADSFDETLVTYQVFYPGQLVIAREFPDGSSQVIHVLVLLQSNDH